MTEKMVGARPSTAMSLVGPDSDQHLSTSAPSSSALIPDDPAPATDLSDQTNAITLLPASEPPPNVAPIARFPKDVILNILQSQVLSIQDIGSIERANISLEWSSFAREAALREFIPTRVSLTTSFSLDNEPEEEEFDILYPVPKKFPVEDRVLPDGGRVVYEFESYEGDCHRYPRDCYRPAKVVIYDLPSRRRLAKWNLHDALPQSFRNDNYTFFDFYHKRDVLKEYSMKVWYKFDGSRMRLHCVSIPLQLLLVIIKENDRKYISLCLRGLRSIGAR
jgi:hypothetical protein